MGAFRCVRGAQCTAQPQSGVSPYCYYTTLLHDYRPWRIVTNGAFDALSGFKLQAPGLQASGLDSGKYTCSRLLPTLPPAPPSTEIPILPPLFPQGQRHTQYGGMGETHNYHYGIQFAICHTASPASGQLPTHSHSFPRPSHADSPVPRAKASIIRWPTAATRIRCRKGQSPPTRRVFHARA